jgi:prepilin-type processing-associated H-X9-DG protein
MIFWRRELNKPEKMLEFNRKSLIGFTLIWRDINPLSNNAIIENEGVTHKNPIHRIYCKNVWALHHDKILKNTFQWKVNVDIYYSLPNKENSDIKQDHGEFIIKAPFKVPGDTTLNDEIEKFVIESKLLNVQLPDGHKNKGNYLYCDFKVMIIGI